MVRLVSCVSRSHLSTGPMVVLLALVLVMTGVWGPLAVAEPGVGALEPVCSVSGLACESWSYRHLGVSSDGPAVRSSVAVTPDGQTVVVAGTTSSVDSHADELVVALDAKTGAVLWERVWDGPASGMDVPHAMTLSEDGSVAYVVSTVDGARGVPAPDLPVLSSVILPTLGGHVLGLVAFDVETGEELWRVRHDGEDGVIAQDLVIAPGERVVVTGFGGGAAQVLSFSQTDGALQWVVKQEGPDGSAIGTAVAADPSGEQVFVTALLEDVVGGLPQFVAGTFAVNLTRGEVVWVDAGSGPGDASGVVVSADGSRVFSSGSVLTGGAVQAALWAFDPVDGTRYWESAHSGTPGIGARGTGLTLAEDGSRVFQAMTSTTSTQDGLSVVELAVVDAGSGDLLDLHTSQAVPGTRQNAYDVVHDAATGSVHMTGSLAAPSVEFATFGDPSFALGTPAGRSALTLSWDDTTGEVWRRAHYERGQSDLARSLSVGPDGALYVAILSHGPGTGRDLVVASYPQRPAITA